MIPTSIEYLITVGLIATCIILKLNFFPRVSVNLPRNLLVALLCGLALLNLNVYRTDVNGRAPARAVEEEFQELRRVLAAEERVGFITDGVVDRSSDAAGRYFRTQDALAPIVLVQGTSPNLIIANVSKLDSKLPSDDLVLVRKFGPRLMLLRRKDQ